MPPEMSASILWKLFEDAEQGKTKVSDKMLSALREIGEVPGGGRLCYIAFGNSADVEYKEILCRGLIEIESNEDVLFLALSRKRKWLLENLDPKGLNLQQSRRELVERARGGSK